MKIKFEAFNIILKQILIDVLTLDLPMLLSENFV